MYGEKTGQSPQMEFGHESNFKYALTQSFKVEGYPDIAEKLAQLYEQKKYDEIVDTVAQYLPLLVKTNPYHYLRSIAFETGNDVNKSGLENSQEEGRLADVREKLLNLKQAVRNEVLPPKRSILEHLRKNDHFADVDRTFPAEQDGTSQHPFVVEYAKISPATWQELRHYSLQQDGNLMKLRIHQDDGRILLAEYDGLNNQLFIEDAKELKVESLHFNGKVSENRKYRVTKEDMMEFFPQTLNTLSPLIRGTGTEDEPYILDGFVNPADFRNELEGREDKEGFELLFTLFQSAIDHTNKYVIRNGLLIEINAEEGKVRYVGGSDPIYDNPTYTTDRHFDLTKGLFEGISFKLIEMKKNAKKAEAEQSQGSAGRLEKWTRKLKYFLAGMRNR